jgi:ATP/maltotriose-dependent transcriptional regulator MalT
MSVPTDGGRPSGHDGAIERFGLTERELEIIGLLMRGFSTDEITAELHVHPQTVRNNTHRIGVKLGVSGRLKIVARARELGISPASD